MDKAGKIAFDSLETIMNRVPFFRERLGSHMGPLCQWDQDPIDKSLWCMTCNVQMLGPPDKEAEQYDGEVMDVIGLLPVIVETERRIKQALEEERESRRDQREIDP